ncbi:uncharacterized protein LOC106180180 [Lingula anatina]|uniref:Uncharacterized protein LOC106180180 n=1 Tax=Lingula anatina TaxID=7574 RepID=A0A1S3KA93_LINAN|nr:uncharacterized protein LOC106180180 [Lingula anatina]|eukprot:XP_013419548.1 uncharacterized protein LOC106180180 [Lingula anatina]
MDGERITETNEEGGLDYELWAKENGPKYMSELSLEERPTSAYEDGYYYYQSHEYKERSRKSKRQKTVRFSNKIEIVRRREPVLSIRTQALPPPMPSEWDIRYLINNPNLSDTQKDNWRKELLDKLTADDNGIFANSSTATGSAGRYILEKNDNARRGGDRPIDREETGDAAVERGPVEESGIFITETQQKVVNYEKDRDIPSERGLVDLYDDIDVRDMSGVVPVFKTRPELSERMQRDPRVHIIAKNGGSTESFSITTRNKGKTQGQKRKSTQHAKQAAAS